MNNVCLEEEHANLVYNLAKDGVDIVKELSPYKAHLLHMAVGICGEAGELLDAIKKCAIYDDALDRDNIVEELGDLEFYMAGLRSSLGVNRATCLRGNIDKLRKRYGLQYSNEAAQARVDKQ